ncbi:unnamed protein product [Vicia faba]|uniref:Uncharacterized protein n=1 Tax=Vicia faba TaxID=3906 RepID=A0AAV1A8S2_VICFA|nr:unnamed protein product [Vicia faba]
MGSDETQRLLLSETRDHSHVNEKNDLLQRRRTRRGGTSDTEIEQNGDLQTPLHPQSIYETQEAELNFKPVFFYLAAYLGIENFMLHFHHLYFIFATKKSKSPSPAFSSRFSNENLETSPKANSARKNTVVETNKGHKYDRMRKDNFSGVIPKELGDLDNLELLDLRVNNLIGNIPAETGRMLLKQLLVHDNKFEGSDSQELNNMGLPSKSLVIDNYSSPLASLFQCKNRKFAHCAWYRDLKQWNKAEFLVVPIKGALKRYLNAMALPLYVDNFFFTNFNLRQRRQ